MDDPPKVTISTAIYTGKGASNVPIPPTPEEHKCEQCWRPFESKCALWRHQYVAHGIISGKPHERNFYCNKCDDHFMTKRDLWRHQYVAHGIISGKPHERNFYCNKCDDYFMTKLHLLKHKLSHNPGWDELSPKVKQKCRRMLNDRTLPCPHCDKKFAYPSFLKKHLKTHDKKQGKEKKAALMDEEDGHVFMEQMSHLQEDDVIKVEHEIMIDDVTYDW